MKIGDKVEFKRFGEIVTGVIIEIKAKSSINTLNVKVKPDNPKSFRKKIALSEKSIKIIPH